jgi:hypothetical protein
VLFLVLGVMSAALTPASASAAAAAAALLGRTPPGFATFAHGERVRSGRLAWTLACETLTEVSETFLLSVFFSFLSSHNFLVLAVGALQVASRFVYGAATEHGEKPSNKQTQLKRALLFKTPAWLRATPRKH